MKITIDVDCTPQEARTFLGLPDVEAYQAEVMRMMQEKLAQGLTPEGMEQYMKTWSPFGTGNWEEMQKAFWSAATKSGMSEPKK